MLLLYYSLKKQHFSSTSQLHLFFIVGGEYNFDVKIHTGTI